jgi:hypothetical protein
MKMVKYNLKIKNLVTVLEAWEGDSGRENRIPTNSSYHTDQVTCPANPLSGNWGRHTDTRGPEHTTRAHSSDHTAPQVRDCRTKDRGRRSDDDGHGEATTGGRGRGRVGGLGGAGVRGPRGAEVAGAADGAGAGGERAPGRHVQRHRHEAQPHHGDHPLAQRLRGPPRLLLPHVVDQTARQGRRRQRPAVHAPGEHRRADLRRRVLRHRVQRYAAGRILCGFSTCSYYPEYVRTSLIHPLYILDRRIRKLHVRDEREDQRAVGGD